jgi:hypothetical protein
VFSSHLKSDNYSEPIIPTKAENIKVYSTMKTPFEFTIIGDVLVSADAGTDSERVVNLMKREASKLGADAIIDLRLEFDYGGWETALKGSAYAVKIKK